MNSGCCHKCGLTLENRIPNQDDNVLEIINYRAYHRKCARELGLVE